MSDIAKELRECAAQIRRTPIRLDTWIPLQQRAADEIERLRAIEERYELLIDKVNVLEAEVEALRAELKEVRADRDSLLFETLSREGK